MNRLLRDPASIKHTWIPLLLAMVFLLSATGCIESILPPQMSAAKFVRPNRPDKEQAATGDESTTGRQSSEDKDSDKGKVNASTGILINTEKHAYNSNVTVFMFPVEGAWTGFLAERYDLSVSINNYGFLGLEGNGILYSGNKVSLGLLHGLQFGMSLFPDEPDESLLGFGASGGLFLQTVAGRRGTFFGATKYTFNALTPVEEMEMDFSFHHATVSLGGAAQVGRLQVIPELIVDFGFLRDDDLTNIMIIPTITLSAGY